ncbi:hypothetical protein [Nonomuraea sp. NEAU-A123]|uniref:hypothetical protein n=1 Tax=Nonomuraea sp. NEAU-A123 TaxID=2839649 RepID=UPI001BE497D0|nr:hypothetical protein [Nonomuraea sp. NEAU-A123]MBT2234279.1 hypothetical protein [Nonomuraea sp. NEAU-A123]
MEWIMANSRDISGANRRFDAANSSTVSTGMNEDMPTRVAVTEHWAYQVETPFRPVHEILQLVSDGYGGTPAIKQEIQSSHNEPKEEGLLDGSESDGEDLDEFEEGGRPVNAIQPPEDLDFEEILARIRQELALRFTNPNDPGLLQRRQRLRVLFTRVPQSHVRQLHSRLGVQRTGDELSGLFHGRLASATRHELLRILQDRLLAGQDSSAPQGQATQPETWGPRDPLPAIAQQRFDSALMALEQKVAATSDPRAWRYRCWLGKLRAGADDRVIQWHRICPTTTGAQGAAFMIDCSPGPPVNQAELQAAISSLQDVEQAGRKLRFITHMRSQILFFHEMAGENVHMDAFRVFHDEVWLAERNLNLWANSPTGGSSGMPRAYRSIMAWIRQKQDDPRSIYSCL